MDDNEGAQIIASLRKFGSEVTGVEAKAARTGLPQSTKESVVAFANSSTGGTIVLGVDESQNFLPVGVDDPGKRQADLASSCAEEIVPPIRPEITLVTVEGATLVVAEIAPLGREQKPAYVEARGMHRGSYVRTGESDRRLTAEEVQQLISDRGQPLFDREAVPGTGIEDLDPDMVERFVQRLRAAQSHIFGGQSTETVLTMTNVLIREDAELCASLAGLLSLGRFPQQFFPQLNATLVVYPGASDEHATAPRFLDNVRLDGSIPVIVREAMGALVRNMSRRSYVTGEGRTDLYDYPPEALREVVVNALIHRDFSPGARGTQVQIEMFSDRVVLKNPGGLFGSVDVTRLGEEGRSSARNAELLRILEDVVIPGEERPICENRGSGIRTVRAALQRAGMSPPVFEDSVTAFRVTMPNHALFDDATVQWLGQIGQEGLKGGQATALALMRRGQMMDNGSYRAATGVRDSHLARQELQDLVARELVDQHGTRGQTKYALSEYAEGLASGEPNRRVKPDRRRQITGLLFQRGLMSKQEISTTLGVSPKTAEHWLRILRDEGAVEASDDGRGRKFTRYRLTLSGEDDALF